MDMNAFRGVMTAIWLLIFIAVVWWAYSPRQKNRFDAASRLALEDNAAKVVPVADVPDAREP